MPTPHATITSFQHHLMADGKSPSTITSYIGDIIAFAQWLESKGTAFSEQLMRFHITSYRNHLLETGYQVNTINKKINSLHSLNNYLLQTGAMTEVVVDIRKDKVKVASGSEKEVEVFSEAELEKLLFYIQDQTRVTVRDKLVVTMLLYTGARVSELVNVKLKDIDFLTLQLKILGKGGKTREVPLKIEVVEAIKEYLETERKENQHSHSEYLLLTQRAGKMDRDTVNKLLKRHGGNLGLEMYPHKFRHTFCSRLLKKGVPITTVSKLAGHSNIQTTASFYINTSRQDKMAAVNLL